jgi:FkbM family methyltransferase
MNKYLLSFLIVFIITLTIFCTSKLVEKYNDEYIDINFPVEKIKLKFMNNDIVNQINYCVNKEKKFKQLILDLIKNKDINNNIIDCGAYYGDNSLPWAKVYNSTVYAFEPTLLKCEYIDKVCKLNNIKNLEIINYGLSDKNEVINIIDPKNHNNNYIGIKNANYNSGIKEKFVKLDDLYSNNVVKNVDFMHFDVEGYEDKVLIGSKKIINDLKPIISVEIHPHYPYMGDSVFVLKILDELQYKCFIIDEICGGISTCRNLICIHKDRKLNTNISDLVEVNYNNVNNLIKK